MVRQYVGARYVPKFASPVEWAADTSYEALTIVTFNNASYTSKIQVPPTVGNPANNPKYWALTGNYNAQVEQYRQEVSENNAQVEQYRQEVSKNDDKIAELTEKDNTISNNIAQLTEKANTNSNNIAQLTEKANTNSNNIAQLTETTNNIQNSLVNIAKQGNFIDVNKNKDLTALDDCSTDLNNLINENPNGTYYFPNGTYKVSKTINIYGNVVLDSHAIIKAISPMNELLLIGGESSEITELTTGYFIGGIIDANGLADIAIHTRHNMCYKLQSIVVKNVKNTGIALGGDGSNAYTIVDGCSIQGQRDNHVSEVGIKEQHFDSVITNTNVYNCKTGFITSSDYVSNSTAWLEFADMYNGSVAFLCKGGWNNYSNCTSDSMQTAFKTTSTANSMLGQLTGSSLTVLNTLSGTSGGVCFEGYHIYVSNLQVASPYKMKADGTYNDTFIVTNVHYYDSSFSRYGCNYGNIKLSDWDAVKEYNGWAYVTEGTFTGNVNTFTCGTRVGTTNVLMQIAMTGTGIYARRGNETWSSWIKLNTTTT